MVLAFIMGCMYSVHIDLTIKRGGESQHGYCTLVKVCEEFVFMLLKGTWRPISHFLAFQICLHHKLFVYRWCPDHPSQPQEFCLRTTIGCWERSKFILLKRRALFFSRREKAAGRLMLAKFRGTKVMVLP